MSDLLSALGSVATFIFTQITACVNMFSSTPLFQLFIGIVVVSLIVSLVAYILNKLNN